MAKRSSNFSRLVTGSLIAAGAAMAVKEVLRSKRRMDIAGKTVLITGGSRGLGLALALEFGQRKAKIAICARDGNELEAARTDLIAAAVDVHTFACDLQDPAQIADLINHVELTCGPVDLLVNNAGTIIVGPAQNMTVEDFEQAMAVNFWAAVHTSLAVIPRMKDRGGGRIVNIGSVGGKMPVPHLAPYCASKFALVGFSATLRSEYSKDGILITNVNPGLMQTGSPRNATFKGKHRAEYAWFSIGDAIPGLSMSAETAARRIVESAIYGDAEVTLGLPAKLAAASYGLAPNLHIELTALINRLLPDAEDSSSDKRLGAESESPLTRSFLRYFGHRAERKFRQLNPSQRD